MILDEEKYKSKMHLDDRVLVLEPVEGKMTLNTKGNVDQRLFRGDNRLHAIRDDNDGLWYLKYESGGLQEPLKQKFTSFSKLLSFTTDYFSRRHINIKEIQS